jgi:nitric oxide reductase large subunit
MVSLFLLIGLVFSPLAAVAAFIITYQEWSRHLLPQRVVILRSLWMAAVAFVFFVVGSVVLGEAFRLALQGS